MKITKTKLEGVVIIEPDVFGDNRGFFMESWNKKKMEEAGLFYDFVQDNHSKSTVKGTLRGIHFQKGDKAQAKLVRCVKGAVLDVAVDLRRNSPTFKQWVGLELSAENKKQLLIPRGFGHGLGHRLLLQRDKICKGTAWQRGLILSSFGDCHGRLMAVLLLRHSKRAGQRGRPDRQIKYFSDRIVFAGRIQRKAFRQSMDRAYPAHGGYGMYDDLHLMCYKCAKLSTGVAVSWVLLTAESIEKILALWYNRCTNK